MEMTSKELIQSIYLGDRGVIGYSVDTLQHRVIIKFDILSRIRSISGNWEHYNEEDIQGGGLIFTDVEFFSVEPLGVLPNDYVHSFNFDERENKFEFLIESSFTYDGKLSPAYIKIVAHGVVIYDPREPLAKLLKPTVGLI
jgi:hypothetical protein